MKRVLLAVLVVIAMAFSAVTVFAEDMSIGSIKIRPLGEAANKPVENPVKVVAVPSSIQKPAELLPVEKEKEEEKRIEVTSDSLVGTRYVSDFGITFLRDWFVGQKITVSDEKTGIYGTLLATYAPSRKFNSGEGEAGWFEGWIGKEGKAGPVEYDVYVGGYSYDADKLSNPNNAVYAGLELKFPKIFGLTPFIGSEYFYVPKNTDQNGFVWRGGFEYENGKFKAKAFITGHDRIFESNSAILASGIVSAEYSTDISKNVELVPMVSYQHRIEKQERDGGLTQGELWGLLTLRVLF